MAKVCVVRDPEQGRQRCVGEFPDASGAAGYLKSRTERAPLMGDVVLYADAVHLSIRRPDLGDVIVHYYLSDICPFA